MKEATIAGKAILLDGLPASIDLLLITATFFLAGYEIKQYIPERFFTSLWTLGITGGLLITLNIIFPYRMDFFFRTYDSYLVNTIEAFSGIIFTLALSSRIALKRNWLYKTLNYFGRITIILLIFHQPAQTMTFQHMMQIIKNPYLAGLVSFLAAIGVPVLVYQLILKNSPRLANWFGLLHPGRSSKEKSQEQPAN
jgi:fucose 4-O-acetylase-like acetyltransferase